MKPKLVADWRSAWKWLSVQAMSVTATFLVVWALLPEKMQDAFSPTELKLMAAALLVAGVAGRLIDQKAGK